MNEVNRIFKATRRREKGLHPDLVVRVEAGAMLWGEWWGTMMINPNSPDMVDTFIHEGLHHLNPEASEAWVRKETKKVMKRLTPQERKRIKSYITRIRNRAGA